MFERGDGDDLMSIFRIENDRAKRLRSISSGEDIDFNWITWANNERMLVSITSYNRIRGAGKNKFPFRRLLSVDIEQSDSRVLLEDERFSWFRFFNDDIIHMLPEDPEHILVGFSKKGDYESTAYKLNIYTGEKVVTQEAAKGQQISDWYADWDGRIRYGYGRDKKSAG